MEYWEFLIQKEGDRNWQPAKAPSMGLEAGRYRVVAHSSRKNTDVEICVTYTSTEEIPPKRRSQKRSRRTNSEGLMVVIPYTHLKPGLWELRCSGDIMSDFLGNSWQEAVQLQVVPTVTEALLVCEPTSPVLDVTPDEQEPEIEEANNSIEIQPEIAPSDALPIPDVASPAVEMAELLSASLAEVEVSHQPDESQEEQVALTHYSPELITTNNPLLDQSLQTLEHILEQVLEPVLQDFERFESPDSAPALSEPDLLLDADTSQQGFTLTLEQDAFVTHRGESLTIAGRIDIEQHNGNEAYKLQTNNFQGRLCYELSDPQTSKVLVAIQHPLPEQMLPQAFSHSLEIPPDCNTRLILGKVTLYGASSAALASQPFTVTADLDELLGAIIPGSKAMPVAKMLVLASNPTTFQDEREELSQTVDLPLNQALLDLVNVSSPQPLSLQPKSQQPLPPQLYQPAASQKTLKSLQLPNFPKIQPAGTSAESSVDLSVVELIEDESEASNGGNGNGKVNSVFGQEPTESAGDIALELEHQDLAEGETEKQQTENFSIQAPSLINSEISLQESTASTDESQSLDTAYLSNAWDEIELPESSVPIADFSLAQSEVTGTQDASESTADYPMNSATETGSPLSLTPTDDSPLSESEVQEVLDTTKQERQSAKGSVAEPSVDRPAAVDNAFQSLNLQDRFWLRLNSLASDGELSEWLKWEVSMAKDAGEFEDMAQSPEPNTTVVEVEEVTQSLDSEPELVDFDESLWEESEEFSGESDDADQLQLPPLQEDSFSEAIMPAQLPLAEVARTDWAEEFVVDDEEQPVPQALVVREESVGTSYPTEPLGWQPEPRIPASSESEPLLPAPTIFVPTRELLAGEPVTLRLKVPPHSARLCVKLWVQDRQSRSLLDGPRWLVDLIPDGAGQLEAMTQLIVPFGSVEIRFEAIAVDIYTQRESHKVMVDCIVVPPDLPNISLDEFEE